MNHIDTKRLHLNKKYAFIKEKYSEIKKDNDGMPDTRVLKQLEEFGIFISYPTLMAIKHLEKRKQVQTVI